MTEALAQTVLQMGMTNYQPLRSYVVRTFPLRILYVGSIRMMWRRFRPMWSDVVISLQT